MYRKELLGSTSDMILDYISSIEEDWEILQEVITILVSHVDHLASKNLIPRDAADKIITALRRLYEEPRLLEKYSKAEDIHEAIEMYLLEEIGSEASSWLPLGRSRNDHVATALRMKTKKLLAYIMRLIIELREALIKKASEHIDTIMPGFTHLQPAQPITFAHYLLHIEEVLSDYFTIFRAVYEITDKSPLGSGALSGTTIQLDRESLATSLGFNNLVLNTLAATSSRDFLALATSTAICLSIMLSRVAEDFIIWSTPQFSYIIPSDKHLATSSMMPHKRNPVTMEIMRAWAGEAIGHLVSLLAILKSTPSGYNLDLQEATKHAWRTLSWTIKTLNILIDFIKNVQVNKAKAMSDASTYTLYITDIAEYVSIKTKKPYRLVYREIANILRKSNSLEDIISEITRRYGFSREDIAKLVSPETSLVLRKVVGSPNPSRVLELINRESEKLERDKEVLVEILGSRNYEDGSCGSK